jgi:hypothetical protein
MALTALARDFDSAYKDFDQTTLVFFLVSWLVLALCIFLAAKLTGEGEGFVTALLASLVAAFVFGVTRYLLPNTLGTILAIVLGSAVIAAFYRARWIKGLIIGVLAVLISIVVQWLLSILL